MVYYPNSPSGYLNPVAIDRIEHPEYEAMVCENTTMRVVQYLYPIIKNTVEMLDNLCQSTETQVPTDLKDNLDFLKNIFNTQVDFHPRNLMGEEASENLNAKLSLHEEWATHEGNEQHSIMNWNNPYSGGTIQQAPPPVQQPMPYGYAPPQPQQQRSLMNPFSWFGGGAAAGIPAWQLPPPVLDQLASGEQYYSGAGGPPPMAQQSGNTQLPAGAIGWSVGTGQPIDFNGQTVQSTGERLVNTALTKFL